MKCLLNILYVNLGIIFEINLFSWGEVVLERRSHNVCSWASLNFLLVLIVLTNSNENNDKAIKYQHQI